MSNIPSTIEEYATQCEQARALEDSFMRGCLRSVRASIRVRNMPAAEKGHLHRAAVRSFGPTYEIVDFDRVKSEGREYRYNFQTGRFYGLEVTRSISA